MKFKSYITVSVATILTFSLSIIIVNWFIDPFNLFNSPVVEGVNKNKTEFMSHSRLGKAFRLKYSPNIYQGLILGSSRTYSSIGGKHPGWEGRNVYNLSLPGASFYELQRYFSLALATQKIEKVVLGLDFFMFNGMRKKRTDFDESSLFDQSEKTPVNKYWREVLPILYSRDTLQASYVTIQKQENIHFIEGIYLGRAELSRRAGLRETFWQVEKQYIYSEWFGNAEKRFVFQDPQSNTTTFTYFEEFLLEARKHNVEVYVFISPAHARLWNALDKLGLWPKFEEWKMGLVGVLEKVDQGRKDFSLWDFSGYNTITMEAVPNDGDTQGRMKWYWEASHYKPNVGDMILTQMLAIPRTQQNIPEDFGVLLRSDNVKSHLENLKETGLRWEEAHPEDRSEIQKEVEKFHLTYPNIQKLLSVGMETKESQESRTL